MLLLFNEIVYTVAGRFFTFPSTAKFPSAKIKIMLTKDKVLKGRYRVIDPLGTGAVYEAFDSIRKANVALKEILIDSEKVPAITERENLKRAFADRAKILAEVKHESLPQIRGYFSEFDRQYLVVELISGDDAGALLTKNEKPISFSEAANWADQLLDALDYLHTLQPAPIVHGDVRPANVKLNARGRIKLLGFDITESAEAKTRTMVGSQAADAENLSYQSLEQILRVVDPKIRKEFIDSHKEKSDKILKQTADARSDIYALGATLYHLTTGQMPVDALERARAIWADEFDPLPTAQELNPAIPAEVSEVLVKALEIEPEKRFGSAMEMRQAFQTAVARAQERETETAKNREAEAARETLLAEEKKLEKERQLVEQERLRLEKERQQQAELIEQQLKAAEAERLKAERRAAEAEKQLLEKKAVNADEKKPSFKSVQKTFDTDSPSKTTKPKSAFGKSSELLNETAQNKKSSLLMPAVIGVIFLVVAAAAGFMFMRSPKNVTAESAQPAVSQTAPAPVAPANAPPVEAAPQPTAEKISAVPATAAPPVVGEKSASQPAAKTNKPAVPQPTPRVEKPAVPKAPANQKKAVTVDDLIGN